MMLKSFIFMFLIFLITGTLIALSSNSWLISWMGLEINLMSLIPIILYKVNFYSTESAIKYFLIQAMASMIIMVTFLMNSFIHNMTFFPMENMIITAALAMKAGLAPFHFWFPQIIMNLNWIQCAITMTWQSVAPIFLISSFFNSFFTYFIIFSSGFIGFLGGFNQNLIKIILAYSSILHSAWMTMLSSISIKFLSLYFLTYTILTLALISPCYQFSINNLNNMNSNKINKLIKTSILFSILSLAGLPPFMGFIAKMMSIKLSMFLYPFVIIMSLILFSILSLFYYFKLMYSTTTNINQQIDLNYVSSNYFNSMVLWMSIMFNMLMPIVIFLS